jgi:YidC/Oxa1 family membrane protein insertase
VDKKTILGLLLIGVVLFGFSWYNSRQQKALLTEQARLDSLARASYAAPLDTPAESALPLSGAPAIDSLGRTPYQQQQAASLGESLYAALDGPEEFFTIENDVIAITLSTRGGKMHSAVLKDYVSYDGSPLNLFEEGSNKFNLSFFTSRTVETEQFNFTPVSRENVVVQAADTVGQSFAMRLYADSASYVEYVYTIAPGNYMVDFDVRMVNMDHLLASNQSWFDLHWETISEQNEKGFENENNYTGFAYRYPGESGIEVTDRASGEKSETINSQIQWVAFKQQFFSTVLIARDQNFESGTVGFNTFEPGSGRIKHYSTQLSVPYTPQQTDYGFSFYLGPNSFQTLKSYGLELQKLVPLGGNWIRWISTLIIIPFFDWMAKFTSNYGLIILLLTVLLKIILFPFTWKSYLSMAKMRLLQPEVQAINEKYPKQEDALKKQQATMALYKSAGASMFGGCLPMLLQMPILFAMFKFFPSSIELRQKGFLWADDLSGYDSILDFGFNLPLYGDHLSVFPILMAVTMILSQKLTQMPQQSSQQMPGMKMMMYFLPVMFLFMFNNSASGLSYYYLLANIITIAQTYLMRAVVSDEKLHAQMKANAAKVAAQPKKKSKFMERYEEAVRQQQAQQRKK